MLIENGKINYNGLAAPLLTWERLEHFSPPRTMLCAVAHLDYAQVLAVYAYDPGKDYPVITERGSFEYCADVPSWTYELARDHLFRALPGLLEEKDDSLYYIGNGAPGAMDAIIANHGVVYFDSFNTNNVVMYADLTLDVLDRLANNLRIYNGKMSGRATNIELAQWCARGNGMWRREGEDQCHTCYDPMLGQMNKPVPAGIVIHGWADHEWHEPTVQSMGKGE